MPPDACPTPVAPTIIGLYWSTPTSGECKWQKFTDTDLTHYTILDKTARATVAKGTTGGRSVPFSSFSTHSYECVLSFINSCGESTSFQVESSIVVGPAPTDMPASVSGVLTPTVEASPSAIPTVMENSTITKSAQVSPIPTGILASQSSSGTMIILGVLFSILLILGLVVFLLKRKGSGIGVAVIKKNVSVPIDPKDASGIYFIKPYKLEDEGKSMWLILTQGETQILGLYSGTGVSEGKAVIQGKYQEADGVKFIEIESLTPTQ